MAAHETKKTQSGLDFKLMALTFKIRDVLRPRKDILKEAGIQPGFQVLDYGCGPGSYILPAAQLIGKTGTLYALDINPLAAAAVEKLAARHKLANVHAIVSDSATGLPADSIDVVLLYDILHDLPNRAPVLDELRRVLKNDGTLSVSDHHLQEKDIVAYLTADGRFNLKTTGEKTFSFTKNI